MFNRHHFFNGHERPFRRGVFRYLLLDHLKDKPSYGYEIIRTLEKRFHGFYTPSPGTIYPTLQLLEEMGQVTVIEQDGKRVYTITNEGRQFLTEHKEFEEIIVDHMKSWWNPETTDDIGETMREFERLAQLVSIRARTVDAKKLGDIRKTISSAYEAISKE